MAESPYKGLIPYSEEDAPYFFGREAEAAIIIANLQASGLTLIYGESGVGKSSVLRAGVAAHLHRQALTHIADFGMPEAVPVVFSNWRDDPVAGLSEAVRAAVAAILPPDQAPPLPPATRTLVETLDFWSELAGADLLIILDQFEEYFLYHSGEEHPGSFAVEFPRAVARPDLRANFLIAIREDGLAQLDRFKGRIPNLFDNYLRILHLDRDAARTAILAPVAEFNRRHPELPAVQVEPALVEAVLSQVEVGQVALGEPEDDAPDARPGSGEIETPYLQLVMTRLWEEELAQTPVGPHTLRLATLDRLGGAQRIVRSHLDAVMSALPPAEQEISARLFRQLVTSSGAKIAYSAADLADYAGLPEARITPILEKLAGANVRILRPVPPAVDQPGPPRWEIFHDVLAAAVLDWRARQARTREREEAAAQLAAERRRANRFRFGFIGVSALVLALVGLILFAFQQRARAEDARADALRQGEVARAERDAAETARAAAQEAQRVAFARELASASVANLPNDPERSTLLALEAVRTSTAAAKPALREAEEALHRAVVTSRLERSLRGHTNAVTGVAVSPDGTRIASASQDGTAKVWEMATGREIVAIATGATSSMPFTVSFSPDGRRIAASRGATSGSPGGPPSGAMGGGMGGGMGGTAESVPGAIGIWDAASGAEVQRFEGRIGTVIAVAFSPDGTRLASAGNDRVVRLWDVASGRQLLALTGHRSTINSLAFSPDGASLASAGGNNDPRVFIWDLATGAQRRAFAAHPTAVLGVAYSPDGRRLATAGQEGVAKVWDADSDALLFSIFGHTGNMREVAFSGDGSRIATANDDGLVKIWTAADGQPLLTLAGHGSGIQGVAWTPDSARIVSASRDGTARIWDVSTGGGAEWLTIPTATGTSDGAALSRDGALLATAGSDGRARLWDARTGRALAVLTGHPSEVNGVAVSPDNRQVATAGRDQTVRVWDAAGGGEQQRLAGHTDEVFDVVYSLDGSRLASVGRDSQVIVWESATGQQLWRFAAPGGDGPYRVAFSPDGSLLATGLFSGATLLMDAATGAEVRRLPGTSRINGLAFSPDGKLLATTGNDGLVHIWDVVSGAPLRTLSGHGGQTYGVAFSPDGRRLATSSVDATLRVWDVDPGEGRESLPLTLYGHSGAIYRVAWSPDGTRLVSTSRDGTSRVYAVPVDDITSIAQQRVTRGLTPAECGQFLHTTPCPPRP